MTRQSLFLSVLVLFLFFSCKNRNNSGVSSIDTLKTQSIQSDSLPKVEIRFPMIENSMGRLLVPGVFHNDEIALDVTEQSWLGIFKEKDSFYIGNSGITKKPVFDAVLDEDSLKDKSGWEIRGTGLDSCFFMISGINLKLHKFPEIPISKKSIFPGDSIIFNYRGIEYLIYASGKTLKEYDVVKISEYRLFLTAKRRGKSFNELLVAESDFDGQMISVLFAGDIDDDGFPDIILNTSNDYNLFRPTLYLSLPAGSRNLLQFVSLFESVGC